MLRSRSCSVLAALLILAAPAAHPELLGKISFPNSGSEAAQGDFLEGVLYLHNFEYEDALDAFVRAREADPDFALAYWGEAMTYNHPLWNEQDLEAGREALERLGSTVVERRQKAGSEREAGYLAAVDTLYGLTAETEGLGKQERDLRYRDALRRLSAAYPDDDEARSFHALSILGSSHEGRDFATYMKAAAVAHQVWERNDQHPGAAHYLIHSFDDPIHAPLGLPMARVYARIAPAAAHAQHMTSHIFVAMGMWADVIDANIIARDVQNAGFAERGRPARLCGHYPYWLGYGYLQQGRVREAEELLAACRESIDTTSDAGVKWHFATMSARHVIDLEAWDAPDEWPADLARDVGGHHNYVFARGLAAYHRGDAEGITAARTRLAEVKDGDGPREGDFAEIAALLATELEGLSLLEADPEGAIETLRAAADLEAERSYMFGPPTIVKPTLELLGEALLELGRPQEAAEAFEKQLERTPRRALALRGLARAAKAAGRWERAREVYGELEDVWSDADELPGVDEARIGAVAR